MPTSPTHTPETAQTFRQALARQQLRAASAKTREQAHRDARRDGLRPAVVDSLFATPRGGRPVVTSAELQRLTVRAMWFAMNVVDLRGRARFLEAHPADDTGENPAGYAMTARKFERATRELANQVIDGRRAEAVAP